MSCIEAPARRRGVPGARCLRFQPLVPYSTDTPPLVLAPAAQAGVIDKRARFREIYCAVLEARRELPDHRRCEEALTRVGEEPAGTAQPVDLGPSSRHLVAAVVLGLGFDCIEEWLEPTGKRRRARAPVRIRPSAAQGRRSVQHGEQRAPDPRCAARDAGRVGSGASGVDRLLEGSARHPRCARHVSGDPQSRRCRGQRGRRGRRLAARQRRGGISGRHAAPLPRRDLRAWRRHCGREPAAWRHAEPGSPRIRCRRTCATTRWSRSRSRSAFRRC